MESGYLGRDAVRVKIYIFPAQLEMIERIATDRGVSKRTIFFECFGQYIGTHLQNEAERRKK
jgi:hypothetical protein